MKVNIATLLIFFSALLIQRASFAQQGSIAIDQSQNLPTAIGKQRKLSYSKMATSAKFIGTALADPDWYNWCISPIWGQDGKVHLFSSRWPAADGMEGWTGPNAEIAHFVGNKPEGPFKYVSTIMKTAMFPDPKTMAGPHTQRTGMMIADKLEGPWRFAGNNNGIVVTRSDDPHHWTYKAAIGADNPAFLKIGKKYYIYYKCGTPEHMKAKYGYAVSDNLEGPYTMCDAPITDNVSYIEDAQAFTYKGNHYLLITDNLGGNTGIFGDLILWKSKTGLDFKLANAEIAMGNIYDYWGTAEEHQQLNAIKGRFVRSSSGKLERPAVLFKNGRPAYLYAVGGVNIHGGKVSESYVFKIDFDK